MNKPKRSTVLIVEPEQTKSIEVNTHLLRYLKPTLIGLGIATAVLTISVVSLAIRNHTTTKDNQALRQKVGDLEGYTSAEVNAKINELRKSEKAVLELQNYLQERGADIVPPVKNEFEKGKNNAAGGSALKISASIPFMGTFAQNTQKILLAAQKMPLGAPVPTEISSRFGGRANPFSGYGGEIHLGLDFRGEVGDPVKATASGVVNYASMQNGYGNIVRITMPELTEERRKEYVKLVRSKGEDHRIHLRGIRRKTKDELDALSGEIGDDEIARGEKELDALTRAHVDAIDDALKRKEAELLEV